MFCRCLVWRRLKVRRLLAGILPAVLLLLAPRHCFTTPQVGQSRAWPAAICHPERVRRGGRAEGSLFARHFSLATAFLASRPRSTGGACRRAISWAAERERGGCPILRRFREGWVFVPHRPRTQVSAVKLSVSVRGHSALTHLFFSVARCLCGQSPPKFQALVSGFYPYRRE